MGRVSALAGGKIAPTILKTEGVLDMQRFMKSSDPTLGGTRLFSVRQRPLLRQSLFHERDVISGSAPLTPVAPEVSIPAVS
jgi:hypothetical protein